MKAHGNRKFYELPENPSSSECGGGDETSSTGSKGSKKYRSKSTFFRGSTRDLIEMVDRNVIGRETVFQGPFGPRRSKSTSYVILLLLFFYQDHLVPNIHMHKYS